MKILISGSTGLVGTALLPFLATQGHEVVPLLRHPEKAKPQAILWDPENEMIDDGEALEGFDVFINLSGENLATGRWTDVKKQHILDSRVKSTRLLAETISQLKRPPKFLLNASAVGYYGNRGDEICKEDTSNGSGFLANVCRQWEEAAGPASQRGVRVVFLRTGVILTPKGGALAKMLPLFKIGLGGVIGSGDQFMSWITLNDLLALILFAINREDLHGPINAVSPNPVKNVTFTKTLGKVLNRPTIFPVPAFALRILLGEMADEMLLSSTRAIPSKAEKDGFQFQHAALEEALRYLLKNP